MQQVALTCHTSSSRAKAGVAQEGFLSGAQPVKLPLQEHPRDAGVLGAQRAVAAAPLRPERRAADVLTAPGPGPALPAPRVVDDDEPGVPGRAARLVDAPAASAGSRRQPELR